jgi:hypothetical protein
MLTFCSKALVELTYAAGSKFNLIIFKFCGDMQTSVINRRIIVNKLKAGINQVVRVVPIGIRVKFCIWKSRVLSGKAFWKNFFTKKQSIIKGPMQFIFHLQLHFKWQNLTWKVALILNYNY